MDIFQSISEFIPFSVTIIIVVLVTSIIITFIFKIEYFNKFIIAISIICAPGVVLHELGHLFFAVLSGCPIDEIKLFKMNHVDYEVANFFEYLPMEKRKFDAVLLLDVIEHIFPGHRVLHLLSLIEYILKNDGYLILTSPNILRLSNYLRLLSRKTISPSDIQSWVEPNYRSHAREYTVDEICFLLKNFSIKDINYWDFSPKRRYTYISPLTKIFCGLSSNISIVAQKQFSQ